MIVLPMAKLINIDQFVRHTAKIVNVYLTVLLNVETGTSIDSATLIIPLAPKYSYLRTRIRY